MNLEKPLEIKGQSAEKEGKLEYALKNILRPAKYLGEALDDLVRKNEIL